MEESIFDGKLSEKIFKDEDELIPKKQKEQQPEEMVYQICEDEDEYYTFSCPILDDEGLSCIDIIKKAVIREEVLNEKLEQFYKEEHEDMEFNLVKGIKLAMVPSSQLSWLKTSKEEAEAKMKDDVLTYYETVVPQLLKRVSTLEAMVGPQNQQIRQPQQRGNKLLL